MFNSLLEAANDFGQTYNDDSIRLDREYGATLYSVEIYSGKDMYSYNLPNIGFTSGVTVNEELLQGQNRVTAIHTHAAYDSHYDKIKYGGDDLNNIPSSHDQDLTDLTIELVVTPNSSLIAYSEYTFSVINTEQPSDPDDPSRKNNIDPYANKKYDPIKNPLELLLDIQREATWWQNNKGDNIECAK